MNNKKSIDKSKKLSKQRWNHGYGEYFDGCQMGEGCEGMDEEVGELRSTKIGSYRIAMGT